WGYTKRSTLRKGEGRTSEYEVVHPQWTIFPVQDFSVHCDIKALYGAAFVPFFEGLPHSVFLADGSAVAIKSGAVIRS
ncbi:MAG: DUF2071 domain-containing protein, partial [Rudanella sp.]|nr:DUF2071 domain-containing protein [Rudanella sp.]